MILVRLASLALVAALGAGCSTTSPTCSGAACATDGSVACLGSFQPAWPVIDPDAPVFTDAAHTQAQVETMFADARARDTAAYRAYRAARDLGDRLTCAYCACGCAVDGHLSAQDCFKDLHGFG